MKTLQSLRLSLRELFLLILVVGMGLGWYLDHRRIHGMQEFLDGFARCAASRPPEELSAIATYRGVTFAVSARPWMIDGVPIEDSSSDSEDNRREKVSTSLGEESPSDENVPVPPAP